MLASELIYDVKNLLNVGKVTDDDALYSSQLLYLIDGYRLRLAKQQGNFSNVLYQSRIFDTVLDTSFDKYGQHNSVVNNLPKMFRPYFIGSADGLRPFQATNIQRLAFENKRSVNAGSQYMIFEKQLQLFNIPKGQTRCLIIGIFEHPVELVKLDNPVVEANYNFEYPMPITWRDAIFKMLVTAELRTFAPDAKNNSTQDSFNGSVGKIPSGENS